MTPGIQDLMREIERVWDGYQRAVHVDRSLDAALAALAPQTSLVNMPMATGGRDRDEVARYLADDLIGHLPADLTRRRVSRTVDRFRVVDEELVSFTHDRVLPWLVPGVAPTHRRVEVLTVTVATLRQARIVAQRTLWDQAGLSNGLGLADRHVGVPAAVRSPVAEPASWW